MLQTNPQTVVELTAVDKELRKGPRGGGRELAAIVEHIIGADTSYLRTLGGQFTEIEGGDTAQQLARLRQEILSGLATAVAGQLPQKRITRRQKMAAALLHPPLSLARH